MTEEAATRKAIDHHLMLLWRGKWLLVTLLVLGMGVGWCSSFIPEPLYQSRASVLVEPSSLPESVNENVPGNEMETYLRSLVEQVRSPTRLRAIIENLNLMPSGVRDRVAMETLVAQMAHRIQVSRTLGGTFTVSYVDSSPEVAHRVTELLTSQFVTDTTSRRMAQLTGTTQLLAAQSARLRAEVLSREESVMAFEQTQIDLLPSNREATVAAVRSRGNQIAEVTRALIRNKGRLSTLQMQLSVLQFQGDSGSDRGNSNMQTLEKRIRDDRDALAQMAYRMTGSHPEYRQQEARIHRLEAELEALRAQPPSAGSSSPPRFSGERLQYSEEIALVRARIRRLTLQLTRLKTEREVLSDRLELIPEVDLRLSELSWGLDVMGQQADQYQAYATAAGVTLALEWASQPTRFHALDRAKRPKRPFRPDRITWSLAGGGLGFLVALFLSLGLDILIRPFLDQQSLADFTGVPVLIEVPLLGTPPTQMKRIWSHLAMLWGFILEFFSPRHAVRGHPSGAFVFVEGREDDSIPEEPELPAALVRGYRYLTGEPVLEFEAVAGMARGFGTAGHESNARDAAGAPSDPFSAGDPPVLIESARHRGVSPEGKGARITALLPAPSASQQASGPSDGRPWIRGITLRPAQQAADTGPKLEVLNELRQSKTDLDAGSLSATEDCEGGTVEERPIKSEGPERGGREAGARPVVILSSWGPPISYGVSPRPWVPIPSKLFEEMKQLSHLPPWQTKDGSSEAEEERSMQEVMANEAEAGVGVDD